MRGFKRLGLFKADADETALLASGVSAAFFPHGVGHSLGQDVHDVPSASKPAHNPTIAQGSGNGAELGHEKIYEYLRLRLPLEEGMVVVRFFFFCSSDFGPGLLLLTLPDADGRARNIFPFPFARRGTQF
jgi:hypothetical protein